ncbi:MAG TPA: J domain-containing protein [Allosphingosinicella sp.]|jgi:curved DNA-binding protein CbpA
MPNPRSLYDVLNVAPEAEPVVLEAAYKALMKKYHPDHSVEAPVPKDAAEINEAFALLKDPARRADYDHRLWSKQQAIRLAELQAVSGGRPPRFVAVSGWLVAGLLAGALAAVTLGKSLAPPLTRVAIAAEVHDSEAPARAAAAKAAAAEDAQDRAAMPSSAAVIARVRAEQGIRADQGVRVAVEPPLRIRPAQAPRRPATSSAPRTRKARPGPRARAQPRREKDFLERQGYIY